MGPTSWQGRLDSFAAVRHHARMRQHVLIALCVTSLSIILGCAGRAHDLEHRRAPGALGPYSGSVASGDLIFVSGQIGQRGGSFEEEVRTTLNNVEARLDEAGASFDDVVQATVYLTDMDNYAAFNEIYAARLGDPFPARVCIEVSRLPGDARVEVQVIARRP